MQKKIKKMGVSKARIMIFSSKLKENQLMVIEVTPKAKPKYQYRGVSINKVKPESKTKLIKK